MAKNDFTATTRTLLNTEESRNGAMACLNAIKKIGRIDLGLFSNLSPDEFWRTQDSAIMEMINAAGIQPDLIVGFIAVLGEYVSMVENDGQPNLDAWIPEATMTPEEIESSRARVLEDIGVALTHD